ncbi:YraN family protein [Paramagnetospirillum kuznetsovii]|uniref:UPF0102 protein CU669_00845 n=1 Tax=Paramagnetospirillum kuznetsovii TaxID=2053833 RepID=A0A364P2Y8_9PROT|nr:YraN family protein [Paramagnetospirillum kuznetsovii]RAU23684.1 YraN family protein [Paramagnetospirillum kuznetsovii]
MNAYGADPRRLQARRRGRLAEGLAVVWLRLKLYRVLARGVQTGRGSGAGEIDIVAKRGRTLIFVEVKSRATLDEAIESIGYSQRRRIETAAAAFLARRPELASCQIRFDALVVAPGRLPHHIRDAWRPRG